SPVGARAPSRGRNRVPSGVDGSQGDERGSPNGKWSFLAGTTNEALRRLTPTEVSHRLGGRHLNVRDLAVELRHDSTGKGRVPVTPERTQGVDSDLDVGIGG